LKNAGKVQIIPDFIIVEKSCGQWTLTARNAKETFSDKREIDGSSRKCQSMGKKEKL
jgi:hypothetical protein